MKKFIAFVLILTMALTLFAGCTSGNTEATGESTGAPTQAPTDAPKANLEGTMEELLNKVIEIQPVEFMGGTMPIDLTDTSEDGMANVEAFTGLDSVDQISEAAVYEPMMGSIPYSMVMVRVAEGVDSQTVAQSMKAGINTRKWICVEADDLKVCSYGDVVMLIMVGSDSGMTAQSFVDAFQSVCGGELDFVIA